LGFLKLRGYIYFGFRHDKWFRLKEEGVMCDVRAIGWLEIEQAGLVLSCLVSPSAMVAKSEDVGDESVMGSFLRAQKVSMTRASTKCIDKATAMTAIPERPC